MSNLTVLTIQKYNMAFTPYTQPNKSSSFTSVSDSMIQKYESENQGKERNILQKTAGFVLDPVAKLGAEAGQFLGKGIVRGIEQFQSPEQRAITEANLQKALSEGTTVPGLGTEVKPLNEVTPRDVAGQVLEAGAMFAPGVGSGASTLAKIGAGATTGYAMDVGQKLQNEDKTLGQSFVPGLGTALGATLPAVGSGVKYVKDNLPSWFVKSTLPKLGDKPEAITNALKKIDYGSVNKNLTKSAERVTKMGSNIDTILNKPENANKFIGSDVLNSTVASFPNSKYTPKFVAKEIAELVPNEAKTIDKIIAGTATPLEANNLKKEIYKRTSKVFENASIPPARKELGATFATSIADKIKNTIDETKPIWDELSKEINLRNALIGASKKAQANAKVGLYDIAGYFAGGIPAVIGERATRNPGLQLSTAKAVNKLGQSKIIPNLAEGAKRLTVKGGSEITR